MKHLFVSYEIAKQLKEKGFDEPCLAYFNGDTPYVIPSQGTLPVDKILTHRNTFLHDTKDDLVLTPEENFSQEWINNRGGVIRSKWGIKVAAPLYQQVIDWFLLKHKISIEFYIAYNNYMCYSIKTVSNKKGNYTKLIKDSITYDEMFGDKTECLNKTIEEALKLI